MPIELPEVMTTRDHGFDTLRPAIQAGALTRLRRGAYIRPDPAQARWERRRTMMLARCVAVAATYTTRFAFSHETAALLHGWSVATVDDRIRLIQTVNPGGVGTDDVERHVRAQLVDDDVIVIEGLPATAAVRTILDCARFLPADRALVVVDSAFRRLARVSVHRWEKSVVRQERLRATVLRRLPASGRCRGWYGLAPSSPLARVSRTRRRRAGCVGSHSPRAFRNRMCSIVCSSRARQFFTDLGWEGEGPAGRWLLVAEFDGAVKYAGDERDPARAARIVLEEKEREDLIRRTAAPIVRFERFTTADLLDPPAVGQRLRNAFPVPVGRTARRALQLRPGRGSRT